QIHFQNSGRAEAHHRAIFFWENLLRVLVVGERLFESGGGDAVMNCFCKVAEDEASAGWIERAEEGLQAADELLGFDEVGFGFGIDRFDQADGGKGRNCRKKLRVASRIEFDATIKFQHKERILFLRGRRETSNSLSEIKKKPIPRA